MDALRFDVVTRALGTRRGFLAGVAAALFPTFTKTEAGKKKKVKKNAFGCVPVGRRCAGKDRHCCSGICHGRKPKRGKKDRSRCVDHDTGGCTATKDHCGGAFVSCTTSAGASGFCFRTTGKASFCAAEDEYACKACRRDADCRPFCGPDAACVVCNDCPGTPTICASTSNCTF